MPHVHPSTIKQILVTLDSIGLLRLELYDDGFVGVLDDPSVCKYPKPIFSSICCWDIAAWRLSASTLRAVHRHGAKPIRVFPLPIDQAAQSWLPASPSQRPASAVIIESKYMDYAYLARLITDGGFMREPAAGIFYCQHPWDLKRNHQWPETYPREIIKAIPIEKYLASVIVEGTHVIAGMTSTVIFLCELVKRGALPRHRLTLLMLDNDSCDAFSNHTEPLSYCRFMAANYGHYVDLRIVRNGVAFES